MSEDREVNWLGEVEIPFGDDPQETAILLLAAAEELDLEPFVVRTGEGVFLVPEAVADGAGKPGDLAKPKADPEVEKDGDPPLKPAPKRGGRPATKN